MTGTSKQPARPRRRSTRVLWTLRHFSVCTALLALLGCQPSLDEVVAEHRASVEAVFAKLEALDANVKATPPLTEDRVETGSEAIVVQGEGSNALFIQAVDLAAPVSASSSEPGGDPRECGRGLRERVAR